MSARFVRSCVRAFCAAALGLALACAPPADAHPANASVVAVDLGSSDVRLELRLPVSELALVAGPEVATPRLSQAGVDAIERYVLDRISVTGTDGRPRSVRVRSVRPGLLDGAPHVLVALAVAAPASEDFALHYRVIVAEIPTHQAFVELRTHWKRGIFAGSAQHLGVIAASTQTFRVRANTSWLQASASLVALGSRHVFSGADHLLFLLMLLLAATCVAIRGRWQSSPSPRDSVRRVLVVVTVFAVSHTLALSAAALGIVSPPARIVEILVAVSIAAAAIHVLRPLLVRGDAAIAGIFGIVHGFAFAGVLIGTGLPLATVAIVLFGFGAGLALAQFIVVALVWPSLYVLSTTSWGASSRAAGAVLGLVASFGWIIERTLDVKDPFTFVTAPLVNDPLVLAAALAGLAIFARAHQGSASQHHELARAAGVPRQERWNCRNETPPTGRPGHALAHAQPNAPADAPPTAGDPA